MLVLSRRIARANAPANASRVSARTAGTPMPSASFTQSKAGSPRSSIESAFAPPAAAPTRINSTLRIAYDRFAKITVVTSSRSRACVQSACNVYIAPPSP